eukprot:7386543-Prymnesium_polylepis.4
MQMPPVAHAVYRPRMRVAPLSRCPPRRPQHSAGRDPGPACAPTSAAPRHASSIQNPCDRRPGPAMTKNHAAPIQRLNPAARARLALGWPAPQAVPTTWVGRCCRPCAGASVAPRRWRP